MGGRGLRLTKRGNGIQQEKGRGWVQEDGSGEVSAISGSPSPPSPAASAYRPVLGDCTPLGCPSEGFPPSAWHLPPHVSSTRPRRATRLPWDAPLGTACLPSQGPSGLRALCVLLNPETDPGIQRHQDTAVPSVCLSTIESEAPGQIPTLHVTSRCGVTLEETLLSPPEKRGLGLGL